MGNESESGKPKVGKDEEPAEAAAAVSAVAVSPSKAAAPSTAAEVAEIVLEEIRRVGKDRHEGHDVGFADRSRRASTRWSGWRSSPRSKSRFGGRFPEEILLPESEPAAKFAGRRKVYRRATRKRKADLPADREVSARELPLRPVPRIPQPLAAKSR